MEISRMYSIVAMELGRDSVPPKFTIKDVGNSYEFRCGDEEVHINKTELTNDDRDWDLIRRAASRMRFGLWKKLVLDKVGEMNLIELANIIKENY